MTARLGRLSAMRLAFLMANGKTPRASAPLEFGLMWGEDNHNHLAQGADGYGLLGFRSYVNTDCLTLALGFRFPVAARGLQPYLMLAYITPRRAYRSLAMSSTQTIGGISYLLMVIVWDVICA